MSTSSDTPKPETPEPQEARDATVEEAAADASADMEAEAQAEAEMDSPEPTGWGKGTIAALRAKLGGDKNADAVADEITKLVDENADMKDRMLRLAADMDNLRKRTDREKADTAKYAVSKFAEDMLRVGDNLGRALESVPEDVEDKDAALKSLRDGIAMTSQELLKGLHAHGVAPLEPKGAPFDPNLHQAIAEIEDAEIPAGHVAEVFQIGYTISGRVLRPAMVVVSKGPAKETAADTPSGEATADGSDAPADAPVTAANDDTPVDDDPSTGGAA